MGGKPANTAEYLATLTDEQRAVLGALRDVIRTAAPGVEEHFSYGMPAFRLDGKTLIWFAAWKNHYSLYPIGPALLQAHAPEAGAYETSKGTIRFPASKPLPWELVRKLVAVRIGELRERGK